MASLEGNKIKDTYKSVLKVNDNGELEATEQEITDGAGNSTGVSLNTQGDVTATGTVAFGSLKDSGEDITVTKFVDEADGIANNDDDNSIPTSAAVKDYVDNNITAQDLDISDGTNTGAVDLDSQSLIFTGDSGVSATVSGQEVSFDSSNLQNQISSNDTDITALQAADVVLQSNIDSEESARIAADDALDALITTEETARITADNTLQANIDSEATTRAAEDASLLAAINTEITDRISADQAQAAALSTEETARIAGDAALQTAIDAEAVTRAAEDTSIHAEIDTEISDRAAADTTLQANIDAEAATRLANDNTLQGNIDAEATARTNADAALQTQITSNDGDITALDTRLTTAEGNITSNDTDIAALDTRLTTAETNITSNDSDIAGLDTRLTTAESNITSNDSDIVGLDTRLTTAEGNITSNDSDIAALDARVTTAEGNITSNDSDIAGLDTRLTTAEEDITSLATSKQSVSEKGQPNGYAGLDSNGTVPVSQLPESVTGSLEFQGVWDASTNTPTLPDPTTVKGHYYKVSVEGTYLGEVYHIGDWALSDGVAWEHIHTQETISDVFGREGSIVAQEGDYSAFYPLISDLAATDANVLANTTKLAGIEDGADVTDATNVAAAGALMSGTAGLGDLADVSTPTPSDGQVLTYNNTSGQWEAAAAGAAPVDSVNGQIGAVVLDADDIDDSATTNKFTTSSDISKLAGIEAGADVTDAANVTTALGTISVTAHSDVTDAGSGAIITSAERTKLNGIEAGADVTDTANVVGALTAGTNITIGVDGTISSTDTNTTYTAGGGLTLAGTQFRHSDTSSASTLTASGRRYVTGLTFDTYGHVTGYTTGTETVVDTNTTYSAGAGIDLVGTTFSHSDTSTQGSVNNADGTVIQDVTVDGYGHITGLNSVNLDGRYYTEAEVNSLLDGKLGTTAKAADSNLLDGINSTSFLRSDTSDSFTTLSGTQLNLGSQVSLKESADRPDLLEITSSSSSWGGIQIRNSSNEGRWSFMTDGETAGFYNDEDNQWAVQMDEVGEVRLYHNGGEKLNTKSNGVTVTGDLNVTGNLNHATHIYMDGNLYHVGDTNTYIGFHAADQWRVVTGGAERFEVNNSQVYATREFRCTQDVVAFYSDMRLKEKTGDIENAVDKVKQLSGFYYVENEKAKELGYENDRTQIGVSAQEVQAVIPEAVRRAPIDIEILEDGTEVSKSGEEYLTVQYERMVPLLIEAIKEQQTQIDELKARLDGITK